MEKVIEFNGKPHRFILTKLLDDLIVWNMDSPLTFENRLDTSLKQLGDKIIDEHSNQYYG